MRLSEAEYLLDVNVFGPLLTIGRRSADLSRRGCMEPSRYLLGLAVREGLVLVTMDKGILHLAGNEFGAHVFCWKGYELCSALTRHGEQGMRD